MTNYLWKSHKYSLTKNHGTTSNRKITATIWDEETDNNEIEVKICFELWLTDLKSPGEKIKDSKYPARGKEQEPQPRNEDILSEGKRATRVTNLFPLCSKLKDKQL